MRAVVCGRLGDPSVLKVEERPIPEPGPADVLIRVGAASVNFPDVLMLSAGYQHKPELPFVPGMEGAGTIEAVGAEVKIWQAVDVLVGVVVLGYAIYWAKRGQAGAVTNKAAFLWNKFPKFVLGFLLISLLVSFHTFTKDQVASLGNLSKWAFLLTFAGVGLRTNLREMSKQGLRPFVVGALGEVLIAALTFGLVLGANRIWGL